MHRSAKLFGVLILIFLAAGSVNARVFNCGLMPMLPQWGEDPSYSYTLMSRVDLDVYDTHPLSLWYGMFHESWLTDQSSSQLGYINSVYWRSWGPGISAQYVRYWVIPPAVTRVNLLSDIQSFYDSGLWAPDYEFRTCSASLPF